MNDTRILIAELKEYLACLERHLIQLQTEFEQLQNQWHTFNAVAEGNYADQFRTGWTKTIAQFQQYINQSDKIQQFLIERLDDLVELDAQNMTVGKKFNWDLNQQNSDIFKKIRQTANLEDKKFFSKTKGELFGHKLVTEKLGYKNEMPSYGRLLDPDSKYDSMPQGFDGVYYDDKTGEIVVAEFKGQDSKASDDQKLGSWVPDVCQKIINGQSPYQNASKEERDLAYKIKEECEKANVRYELFRTKFDSDSGQLYTELEDIKYLSSGTIQPSLAKLIFKFYSGLISNDFSFAKEKQYLLEFNNAKQDESLPIYERKEAAKLLQQKLLIIYDMLYHNGKLNKKQKQKFTRLINIIKAKIGEEHY